MRDCLKMTTWWSRCLLATWWLIKKRKAREPSPVVTLLAMERKRCLPAELQMRGVCCRLVRRIQFHPNRQKGVITCTVIHAWEYHDTSFRSSTSGIGYRIRGLVVAEEETCRLPSRIENRQKGED